MVVIILKLNVKSVAMCAFGHCTSHAYVLFNLEILVESTQSVIVYFLKNIEFVLSVNDAKHLNIYSMHS